MIETEFVIEPGKQDIVMTCVFDAPKDVVFAAMTDPKLIPSWWGPRRYETIVDYADIKSRGSWRYLNRADDGGEHAFHGVFHVVTPDRIVQTFEYEGAPGEIALETGTFEEAGGKTRYTAVSLFPSVEARDAMAQSGMQDGATETMERFAELLKSMA